MLRPLMPMVKSEFNLDYTQIGFLFTAFTLTNGLSQIPAGWLADRFSLRLFVAIGVSGVAVSGLLIGLSPSYTVLIVFLILSALLGGGYHPSAQSTISALVPPERRGRALGLHLIGGSSSMFIVPVLAASISLVWGWRGAYITLSIPMIILGIVLYGVLGRRLRDHNSSTPRAARTGPAVANAPTKIEWRQLIPFIVIAMVTGVVAGSVTNYMSVYLVDHFGVSEASAAMLVTFVAAPGLVAAPLGGYLSDRVGRVRMLVIVSLITIPIVYLLGVAPSVPILVAILFIEGIINYFRVPNTQVFIAEHTPERRRATLFGAFSFVSMEISGFLASGVGFLIDRVGFQRTFTIASLTMAAVTGLFLVPLWRSRR
ncbi:MAG: MFS transporter [Chloroflexi bacterium]|nr:MFS transporter [Chloroflexota bacterium]